MTFIGLAVEAWLVVIAAFTGGFIAGMIALALVNGWIWRDPEGREIVRKLDEE